MSSKFGCKSWTQKYFAYFLLHGQTDEPKNCQNLDGLSLTVRQNTKMTKTRDFWALYLKTVRTLKSNSYSDRFAFFVYTNICSNRIH